MQVLQRHLGRARVFSSHKAAFPTRCSRSVLVQPLDFLIFFASSHSAAACFHSSAVQTEDCSRWLTLKGNRGPERRVALINRLNKPASGRFVDAQTLAAPPERCSAFSRPSVRNIDDPGGNYTAWPGGTVQARGGNSPQAESKPSPEVRDVLNSQKERRS